MQQNTDVPIPPEIRHQIEDWHELRRLRFHQQAISHNQRVMDHNQRVILEKLTQRSAPRLDEQPAEQYVTLDSAAGWAHRSKRTLENYRGNGLPEPDVKGKDGQPHEWRWTTIRPWLETTFNLAGKLPERLPAPFRAGADRRNLKNLGG